MSLFDSIFGVLAGPVVAIPAEAAMGRSRRQQAEARGASIAAVGGLGGTAIEAAAGDDDHAVSTGLTADTALGGAAATVATLGAAAPAAAAGTAAVSGGTAAGTTAGTAATTAGVTAGTAAGAGAAGTALGAAPTVAGSGIAAAGAGLTAPTIAAGNVAGQVAGQAATTAATQGVTTAGAQVAPATAGEVAINETAHAGTTSLANTQTLKDAVKVGGQIYSNVSKAAQPAPEKPPLPTVAPAAVQTNHPTLQTPNLSITNTALGTPSATTPSSQFDSIFGKPAVSGTPGLINPQSTASPLNPLTNDQLTAAFGQPAPLTPPPLLAPPPMIQMSDRTNKTQIKNADRSVQDFLNQIYGRI